MSSGISGANIIKFPLVSSNRTGGCAQCQNTGWERIMRVGQAGVRRCSAPAHLEQWLLGANVPPLYIEAALSNFRERPDRPGLTELIRAYCRAFPRVPHGYLFTGPSGAGKTHLAVAIIGELLRLGIRHLRFYDTADLLRKLDPKTGVLDSRRRQELHLELERASLIVLDDLAVEPPSRGELEQLDYLVDAHYRQMKPIIITSRWSPQALVARLSPRLLSRLSAMTAEVALTTET